MDDLFLLGRLLFGGYFLYSGVNNIVSAPTMAQFAATKGVPMPEASVMLAGALLIVGGLCVLLGILPRIGLACIMLFLVVVTPTMHNFWAAADPQMRQMDLGNFLKNLALLGGALMMLIIPTPWPFSVERMARRRITA
jgi:putative oxidoreductase